MLLPLPFWKVQAIGNDFPLVRIEDVPEAELPALAVAMADRKFGVGGDGLLVFGREAEILRLRMFNPDGTEDFCGNGLRAAARWGVDHSLFVGQATIHHRDRDVPVRVDGERIETDLGRASYEPKLIPMLGGEIFDREVWAGMDTGMPVVISGSALTTGSTHVILPTYALPDEETFLTISRRLENDPKFPERTSVIWSRRDGERELTIRIWERGVGETLGCGTGSSAAAVDFARRGGKSGEFTVHNPGGTVHVRLASWDAPITLIGDASVIYEGEWLGPQRSESAPGVAALPPHAAGDLPVEEG